MRITTTDSRLGAWSTAEGTLLRVWAPQAEKLEVVILDKESKEKKLIAMEKQERGYFSLRTQQIGVGGWYKFRLNNETELPDPASKFQPQGPHGPSQVIDDQFNWSDQNWKGSALEEWVIYELHVGTFTPEGTFEAVEEKLDYLKELGVTAIEIMPVAQFPGERNWGYDGVDLYAVQNSYSKKEVAPLALKRLVNCCHQKGIAVILDVVYNHFGPEGNYLKQYGPYFQNKYKTPWGEAVNFDGEGSDEVRHFFLENARQWLEDFHFDGLRLDAVHAIFDTSAQPFLAQLAELKRHLQSKLDRPLFLIAESDANDSRLVTPLEQNGLGMDGQWADELHHTLHGLLTGERSGYYADYGTVEQLVQILKRGVYYEGQYSPSRRRSHGRSYNQISHHRLLVCSQNHDQVGNRKNGERLTQLIDEEKLKLAACCVFLSGCLPLLFMGEEVGEKNPFLYFVDHTDADLLRAVRKGRSEEFKAFEWSGEVPDPSALKTYEKSKLSWSFNPELFELYSRLTRLSRYIRRERLFSKEYLNVSLFKPKVICLKTKKPGGNLMVYLSFSSEQEAVALDSTGPGAQLLLSSSNAISIEDGIGQLPAFSAIVWGLQPSEVS